MAKCSYVLKTQVVFFSILLLRLAPVCSQPQLEVMLEEQSHCTPTMRSVRKYLLKTSEKIKLYQSNFFVYQNKG